MVLADIYGAGRGESGKPFIPADRNRALAWYQKALSQGSPDDYPSPTLGLAHLLLQGQDNRSKEQGVRLMSQASEMGYAAAKIYLAYAHANGRYVTKDASLARTYMTQAGRLEDRIRNWGRIGGIPPPMDHGIADFGIRVPPEFAAAADRGHGSNLFREGSTAALPVKDVIFEGNTVFPQGELKRVSGLTTESYELKQLDQHLLKLRAYYRQNGYFLAQVYVPPQPLTNGVMRVLIWEGRIDKVIVSQKEGEQCFPPGVLEAYFSQAVPPGSHVTEHALEAAVLPLYDALPCNLRTELSEGARVGVTNFTVTVAIDKNAPWR
jgi:hypothetical protein